ncbi:DsbA family protein [Ferruginivarius sediminum]|nr:DsbA family protein [Ferruginivarius sediminum]
MKLRKILFLGGIFAAAVMAIGLGQSLIGAGSGADAHTPLPAAHDIAAPSDASDAMQRVAVTDIGEDEYVLGDPDAPLTIIEYASLTCPHCASFHRETLPKLKENWIEPGKAKLVYRHYPLDELALRGALLANCFEGDKFFAVLDLLFKSQQRWARAQDPIQALARIGGMAGLDQQSFETCMTDQAEADSIIEMQLEARNEIDLTSTPTFVVEGEKVVGSQPYEVFAEKLQEAEQ